MPADRCEGDRRASQVIRVDTTGPGQSDVFSLPWARIPRPVYPLDPIDDWRRAGT